MSKSDYAALTTAVTGSAVDTTNSTASAAYRKYSSLSVYPALIMLAFAIPTTTNLRLAETNISSGPSTICATWLGRRRDEDFETYSPYYRASWPEMGPLRIAVARHVNARLQYQGHLKMLPIVGEF
jgi:hypothetical protein